MMNKLATTTSMAVDKTKNAATKGRSKPREPTECPIFLKKTYYMIDTCEPEIACWSEDGLTFVVKDPDVFERKIIPQYFKHSKFSSFVRQLNFYGFRKIKYNDSLRIDPKVEAETANYWRFKHEKFMRGRPELLIEIRRMNSSAAASPERDEPKQQTHQETPVQEPDNLQHEVSTLKERLAKMSQTIEELTALVKNVSLAAKSDSPDSGSKRKKIDGVSLCDGGVAIPETSTSAVEMKLENPDEISFTPNIIFPPSDGCSREESSGSSGTLSDQDFVDEFLAVTPADEMEFDATFAGPGLPALLPVTPQPILPSVEDPDAPDPVMMKKLSDALKLLPRDMQELLVEKLVTTITDGVKEAAGLTAPVMPQYPTREAKEYEAKHVPMIPVHA